MTTSTALQTLMDRATITQVVQDWGLARDAGRWDLLRSFYTADATITEGLPTPNSEVLTRLYAEGRAWFNA